MTSKKQYRVQVEFTGIKEVFVSARNEKEAIDLAIDEYDRSNTDYGVYDVDVFELNPPDPEGLEPSLRGMTL